jgi:hypothetical protein
MWENRQVELAVFLNLGFYYHADVDEQSKKEIKDILLAYDRTLLVADPRRCEPKKCAPILCAYSYHPILSFTTPHRPPLSCDIFCADDPFIPSGSEAAVPAPASRSLTVKLSAGVMAGWLVCCDLLWGT